LPKVEEFGIVEGQEWVDVEGSEWYDPNTVIPMAVSATPGKRIYNIPLDNRAFSVIKRSYILDISRTNRSSKIRNG